MASYDFTLTLNRMPSEAEIEALYEAGCDDGTIRGGPSGGSVDFHREAGSLSAAITSAVSDVAKVPGLHAVSVGRDDGVTLADIANRAGRSRESIRLLALGKRGPGGSPCPSGRVRAVNGSGAGAKWPPGCVMPSDSTWRFPHTS